MICFAEDGFLSCRRDPRNVDITSFFASATRQRNRAAVLWWDDLLGGGVVRGCFRCEGVQIYGGW